MARKSSKTRGDTTPELAALKSSLEEAAAGLTRGLYAVADRLSGELAHVSAALSKAAAAVERAAETVTDLRHLADQFARRLESLGVLAAAAPTAPTKNPPPASSPRIARMVIERAPRGWRGTSVDDDGGDLRVDDLGGNGNSGLTRLRRTLRDALGPQFPSAARDDQAWRETPDGWEWPRRRR